MLADDVRRRIAAAAVALHADWRQGLRSIEIGDRTFDLCHFLLGRSFDDRDLAADEQRVIDMLSRQLEIRRELHQRYELPGFRPLPGSIAEMRDVDMLLTLLLHHFAQSGDYRLLNTVLKTTTGLLRTPVYEPAAPLRELLEVCMTSLQKHA